MRISLSFNIVGRDMVKVWFRKIKAGNFNIEDKPRCDRTITFNSDQLK